MLNVALRTAVIYVFISAVMRFSGKRQVGQMQIGELVSALLLSEVASLPIADPNVPLSFMILPVALIILLEIASSCLCALFPSFKKLVEGTPAILISDGTLHTDQLFKARLSPDELLAQLRLKGVPDLSSVDYAILEQNGQLSVIVNAAKQPLTCEDADLRPANRGIALPLIVCGHVNTSNMKKLGIKKKELQDRLSPRLIKDVLLYTVDREGAVETVYKA